MFWIYYLTSILLVVVLARPNQTTGDRNLHGLFGEPSEQRLERIRSPMLEVFMHLPPNFHDVGSFKRSLGIKSERTKRKTEDGSTPNSNSRKMVDVRTYEIVQLFPIDKVSTRDELETKRSKREAASTETAQTKAILEKPEPEKLVSPRTVSGFRETYPEPNPETMPIPDAIRGPIYKTYPVKEFDIVDIDDPDDPRRRRNDSAENRDERDMQRDKRKFMEGEEGETTTTLPFWKRKKESPPFVTGRGGSIQTGNAYTPPQHRSGDNARESHSLKNLDKSVQSNEISRSNQDNYYSSTNRRTYSRQSDNAISSTPKSVYDTIDYSSKRNQDGGRTIGRAYDDKKETLRDGRIASEQYVNRQYHYNHPVYDRPYYQPPYPYPTEVLGRGVEYYHRTYEPSTGRIVYYANMPDHGRSYDYRFIDRNFYVNNRPFFDPYYRNYVPPYDYRWSNGFRPVMDYMRTGRSSSQQYAYPYQDREKFTRDARLYEGYERGSRQLKDDLRNKTYIIYDAEENRSQAPRTQFPADQNRLSYVPASNNLPGPQVPFRQFPLPPPIDYIPQAAYPIRNQFYPSASDYFWGFGQRPAALGATDFNMNSRPLNAPNVQLPLTAATGNLHPPGDLDKSKKS